MLPLKIRDVGWKLARSALSLPLWDDVKVDVGNLLQASYAVVLIYQQPFSFHSQRQGLTHDSCDLHDVGCFVLCKIENGWSVALWKRNTLSFQEPPSIYPNQ